MVGIGMTSAAAASSCCSVTLGEPVTMIATPSCTQVTASVVGAAPGLGHGHRVSADGRRVRSRPSR